MDGFRARRQREAVLEEAERAHHAVRLERSAARELARIDALQVRRALDAKAKLLAAAQRNQSVLANHILHLWHLDAHLRRQLVQDLLHLDGELVALRNALHQIDGQQLRARLIAQFPDANPFAFYAQQPLAGGQRELHLAQLALAHLIVDDRPRIHRAARHRHQRRALREDARRHFADAFHARHPAHLHAVACAENRLHARLVLVRRALKRDGGRELHLRLRLVDAHVQPAGQRGRNAELQRALRRIATELRHQLEADGDAALLREA